MGTFIDSSSEDKITKEESASNLAEMEKSFFPDSDSAQNIVDTAGSSELGAQEVLDLSSRKEVRVVDRAPSILTSLRKRTSQFFSGQQPQRKNKLFGKRTKTYIPRVIRNPYQKYKYFKSPDGKVIRKELNPPWLKFEKSQGRSGDAASYDRAGRLRGGVSGTFRYRGASDTRFKQGSRQLLKSFGVPIDSEVAALTQKKNMALWKMSGYASAAAATRNKFSERLALERNYWAGVKARRDYNTDTNQSFAAERLKIRKEALDSTREHSRTNNICNSHRNMVSEKQMASMGFGVDIFDSSILKVSENNNIMRKSDTSIINTGKLKILNTKEAGNNLEF